jgi:hypothetical protein
VTHRSDDPRDIVVTTRTLTTTEAISLAHH